MLKPLPFTWQRPLRWLLLAAGLHGFGAAAQQTPQVIDPAQTDPTYAARKLQLVQPPAATPAVAGRSINPPGTPLPACFEPLDRSTYTPVPRNDDGSLGPVNLGFTFYLFGTPYNSAYINTNGNITFAAPLGQFTAIGFPNALPMVAPFWADVDTRTPASGNRGKAWYRLYTDRLVVTWDSVGYFSNAVDKVNTFQVTIFANASGLLTEDVVFAYGDMQWTTGSASGGNGGFGGTPAAVGVNEGGSGGHYTQIGRFGQDLATYTNNTSNSGIDYLDYKCFTFRVHDIGNQPPVATGLPIGNSITVNQGQLVTLTPQFLGPEPGQNVTVTANTGSLCNTTVTVGPGGNPVVNLSILGSPCNIGTSTITFAATDNGVPAASSTFTLTVVVNPPLSAAIWDGDLSTDYLTAQNWVGDVQPQPADSILIPSRAPRFPVLTGAAGAGNFHIAPGASMEVAAGSQFKLNGYLLAEGPLTGAGTLNLRGSVRQLIGGAAGIDIGTLSVGSAGALQRGALAVRQVLSLDGVLTTGGFACTLVSDANNTAMAVNLGTGRVVGNATVQRYISPSLNAGLGYRHLAMPVESQSFNSLSGPLFTPVLNAAYNTVGNSARPFPNVFSFDQSRVISSAGAGATDFDRGWLCPAALTDPLANGKGYTVNLSPSAPVAAPVVLNFTGALHNGPIASGTLARGSQTQSGWHLLGNPYPAPIDWNLARTEATGLDDAVYVFKSTGQYVGTYDTYVNGMGTARYISVAQGFFVRTAAAGAPGKLNLTNASRVTTYQNPAFNRPAPDPRPQLRLELVAAGGQRDAAYVYFEQGATAGFDSHYDAYKLNGYEPLSLASGAGLQPLSISGLPLLAPAGATVPLRIGLPAAGSFTLHRGQVSNFAASTPVWLEDRQTGQWVDLQQQPDYVFQAARADAAATRFVLHFGQARPLATATALPAEAVSLWPNPARNTVQVNVLGLPTATRLHLTLLNGLGQTVRQHDVAAPAGTALATLDLSGLAPGVYTLRGRTESHTFVRNLVVE